MTSGMTSHCIYNVMTASDVPWICSVHEEDSLFYLSTKFEDVSCGS